MVVLRASHQLAEGELSRPVLWLQQKIPPAQIPPVPDEIFMQLWPDGKMTQRLATWGHDSNGVHWLATRSGTGWHNDVGFPRYTHHLTLRNDRWRIHGLEDKDQLDIPLIPGTMLCLDTWSPHKVSFDPRLPNDKRWKVALAVDRDEPLSPDEAWELLSTRWTEPVTVSGDVTAGYK
jgi:hypothetical protein